MSKIKKALEAEGFQVWVDATGLKPGTPIWQDAIETAIENSECMVVILSPDAKKSEWVKREIEYAVTFDVKIFPIIVQGSKRNAIPIQLINSQRTDLRSNNEAEMHSFLLAISEHMRKEPDQHYFMPHPGTVNTINISKWMPLIGKWELHGHSAIYRGPNNPQDPSPHGVLLSNIQFNNGIIHARIYLTGNVSGRIIYGYDIENRSYFSFGLLGYGYAFVLDDFNPRIGWQAFSFSGTEDNIEAHKYYKLKIVAQDETITMEVNDINVLCNTLPRDVKGNQLGLFAWGYNRVEFTDVKIEVVD